jgi:uncharacterized membrane protein
MRTTLVFHILAGTLALVAGFVALYTAKGASTHRKSGRMFVYTMIPMAVFGGAIAVGQGVAPEINVPASLLTSYLVITSLTTVRPPVARARLLEFGAFLVAVGVAVIDLTFAVQAIISGGTRNGMPAFPFIMFGVVALLGSVGDFRVMRSGALQGSARLARHLWRMTFALFIATLSFSVQILKRIPEPFRFPGMLAVPMLLVIGTMFYWLWRMRAKRPQRGVIIAAAEAA